MFRAVRCGSGVLKHFREVWGVSRDIVVSSLVLGSQWFHASR